MSAVDALIHCDGCARTFIWKPQYAGRKLRCKCGQVIQVRATAEATDGDAPQIIDEPTAAHATGNLFDNPFDAGAADIQSPHTSRTLSQPVVRQRPPEAEGDNFDPYGLAPMAAIPLTRAEPVTAYDAADDDDDDDDQPAASPILGYKSFLRRRNTEEDDQITAYQRKEMILPAILIAIGLLATLVEARIVLGAFDILAMGVFVAVSTVINLVLIFVALLVASKLLDLGLGEVGPALLKIAAVAILPSAIGGMINASTGFIGGMLAWAVSLALYFLLLYNLFDMDGQEMMITAVIIWFMRTWVAYFVIMAILGTGSFNDEDDTAPINSGGGGGGQWVAPSSGDGSDTGDGSDPDSPETTTPETPDTPDPDGDTPKEESDTPEASETPEKPAEPGVQDEPVLIYLPRPAIVA